MSELLQSSRLNGASTATPIRLSSFVAELVVDSGSHVLASNEMADALFRGLLQPDKSLPDTLVEAEKSGILASGASHDIVGALSRGRRHLFDMRDGRTFLMTPAADGSGNMNLSIADVSYVVQMTLSRQRDALTGLPNRAELVRSLEEQFESRPDECWGALLCLDLDKFKQVNDTLGHPVGDALLKLVSERLSRILTPKDFIARIGSDEFVILQQVIGQPQAARELATRIIDLIGRTYLIQGHSVQVGANVGIALGKLDGGTAEELIRNADLALFKAKTAGRSTFRFFTEAMDVEMQRRRALEIDLQRALVLDQFHLVYQPQFQIGSKRLVGFESLLRWSTPERGHVSPGDFIPVAEEIGLMDRLGEWVLRRACRDAATWPHPLSVSVNVSPVQFKNPKLMEIIVSALANSGLEPDRLDIEITEGALMDDTSATVSILKQMKALGIRISMDDFGTGYSSLSYLQKFPFDKIKIDQSFIRNIETSADSVSIVRAVAALGESLGMTTIAEGVETQSQLEQIARGGCKQVQGYLTGRPVPLQEASALAQAHLEKVNA